MQSRPKVSLFRSAARIALASLLCVLLLAAITASANDGFHKRLHAGTGTAGHLCLVCCLIKGHISGAEAAPVLAPFAAALLLPNALPPAIATARIDVALAHSRGPPAILISCPVVG